ncbi:type IVB secretion system protein IcmX [Legionella longbeachae]|uniref:Intracellular multiplication protein IcmX n=1 Tax=Legionella longbeachae serogroup 1 (strain NSW150) TaxID=661367 RepID=D3HP76_LEGLN|nr:type IVB secretion system protein IcmX [Legionella longbeachae]VEE01216.1 Intracellular multiplication protein IcmX [Legionella oakridgensis]HBD7398345.1 type IVB secretion system protein IcmX [Legionella pneumophila]ARB92414.1 phosphoesterase [Legionella longbeachae]ARM34406.1 phosphoesterase [Legionella longbeachae]EEZ96307.1 IcmX [Legionella longbeachae D-4968]
MKLPSKFALFNLLCLTTFSATADNATSLYNSQQMSSNMQELVQYLQNWGQYIGYDITQSPSSTVQNFSLSQNLLNLTTTQLTQVSLFYTYLGAIPFNSFNISSLGQFVPTDVSSAGTINPYANATFQDYSSQSTSGVGVNQLIDQTGQASTQGVATSSSQVSDPVSQSVLNILGTPDYSYCMSYDGSSWDQGCNYLTETLVSNNVIGTLPDATTFFSYNYIQQFLGQLNSNSLTAPLMYTIQSQESSGGQQQGTAQGLTADNQAQQAANFIRYATGGVAPIKLPNWKDYDTLYGQAIASSNNSTVSPSQQHQAQDTLSRYLASLRTYAAQNSVGVSNLYYILSKRLPQTPKQPLTNSVQIPSSPPTSQALNEFNMATWRIFNPENVSQSGQTGKSGNTQWISQINTASSVTVEKEIAILLAEINYQMYLDRQIHERLLLTNTILLMQSLRSTAPSADFTQQQQQ